MATNRSENFHNHGDTGTKPADGHEFAAGEKPDAEEFDFFWNHSIEKHKDWIAEFDRLDSNDDGIVDQADTADALGGRAPSGWVRTDGNNPMSGNLDFGSNDAVNLNNLAFDGGADSASVIKLPAEAGASLNITDSYNGQSILTADNGGNVTVNNGKLSVQGAYTISIASGGNDINFSRAGNSFINFSQSGVGGTLWVRDNSNNAVAKFHDGGAFEITNGDLQFGGSNHTIQGGNGSLIFTTGDASGDGVYVRNHNNANVLIAGNDGSVTVPSGNVDLSNNTLTNVNNIEADSANDNPAIKTSGSGNGFWRIFDESNLLPIVDFHEGGNVTVPHGSIQQGTNPANVISETTSPKSFDFAGSDVRDIHDYTDVTISNSSGASATEDITVELYDGTDTTGTLLQSETKSVSVADASSKTVTFIQLDEKLDNGTYHVNITQSGTTLSIDQTDEYTLGATYTLQQSNTGVLELVNQNNQTPMKVDPIGNSVTLSEHMGKLTVRRQANNVEMLRLTNSGGDYLRFDNDYGKAIFRGYQNSSQIDARLTLKDSADASTYLQANAGELEATDSAGNTTILT